jgi:RNA-directed DNA polymerase
LDCWFETNYVGLNYNEKNRRRRRKEGNAFYLRYADDFVVAWNGSREKAEQLKADLSAFLTDNFHLELSQEKTHITHVTDGFDFLGFTVKRIIDLNRGYNELVFYPSKKSVLKLKRKIKDMTCQGTTLASVRDKIEALNYLLRGWSNYYRHSCASQTFGYVGSYAFKRMELWLRKKTRLKVRRVYQKYYQRRNGGLTWADGDKDLYHPGVHIRIRYKKYRHRPNPYLDAQDETDLPYHLSPYPGKREWQGSHSYGENWTAVRQEILERDGFCCRLCGRNDRVEVHHRRKYQRNKEHQPENLITLCSTCHRQVRNPRSNIHHQLGQIST